MANFNHKGPEEKGPKTGRGMGKCGKHARAKTWTVTASTGEELELSIPHGKKRCGKGRGHGKGQGRAQGDRHGDGGTHGGGHGHGQCKHKHGENTEVS